MSAVARCVQKAEQLAGIKLGVEGALLEVTDSVTREHQRTDSRTYLLLWTFEALWRTRASAAMK